MNFDFENFYSSDFCSRKLKAIANPVRWAVVTQLIGGTKTVGELNVSLDMDLTLLSHHLKILRDEGFVECFREGKRMRYRLSTKVELTSSGLGINLGCCRLELNTPYI